MTLEALAALYSFSRAPISFYRLFPTFTVPNKNIRRVVQRFFVKTVHTNYGALVLLGQQKHCWGCLSGSGSGEKMVLSPLYQDGQIKCDTWTMNSLRPSAQRMHSGQSELQQGRENNPESCSKGQISFLFIKISLAMKICYLLVIISYISVQLKTTLL